MRESAAISPKKLPLGMLAVRCLSRMTGMSCRMMFCCSEPKRRSLRRSTSSSRALPQSWATALNRPRRAGSRRPTLAGGSPGWSTTCAVPASTMKAEVP